MSDDNGSVSSGVTCRLQAELELAASLCSLMYSNKRSLGLRRAVSIARLLLDESIHLSQVPVEEFLEIGNSESKP